SDGKTPEATLLSDHPVLLGKHSTLARSSTLPCRIDAGRRRIAPRTVILYRSTARGFKGGTRRGDQVRVGEACSVRSPFSLHVRAATWRCPCVALSNDRLVTRR